MEVRTRVQGEEDIPRAHMGAAIAAAVLRAVVASAAAPAAAEGLEGDIDCLLSEGSLS